MTTPFKREIEDRVRAILKADSAFDDVAVFVRGVMPDPIAQHWFPLAEIMVDTEDEDAEFRVTHVDGYRYGGFVQFSALLPDHPEVADRESDIASYDQVAVWANRCLLLLNAAQTLSDLVSSDGKERVRQVNVALPKYAIGPSRARQNNLDALAMVQFDVRTARSKT